MTSGETNQDVVVATCDIRSPNEPFENTFPRFSRLAGETVGE
jgi:hypothetical protein